MINVGLEVKNWLIECRCDNGFRWNPSICDNSYDVGKYLDYINCKCKKRLIDKLVEEYSKDFNENEINYNVALCDFQLNEKDV